VVISNLLLFVLAFNDIYSATAKKVGREAFLKETLCLEGVCHNVIAKERSD